MEMLSHPYYCNCGFTSWFLNILFTTPILVLVVKGLNWGFLVITAFNYILYMYMTKD